jgi:hypothetical protein
MDGILTDQLQVRRGISHSDVKSTAQLQVRRGASHSAVKSTAQHSFHLSVKCPSSPVVEQYSLHLSVKHPSFACSWAVLFTSESEMPLLTYTQTKRVLLNYRQRRGTSHSDVKSTAQLQAKEGHFTLRCKEYWSTTGEEGNFTLRCKEYCSTTGEGLSSTLYIWVWNAPPHL